MLTIKKSLQTLAFLSMLLLFGCAFNSDIVEIDSNTYFISQQASSAFAGLGTLKADAMQNAYEFCKKKGMGMKVLETSDSTPPYVIGNFPRTEVTFKCLY